MECGFLTSELLMQTFSSTVLHFTFQLMCIFGADVALYCILDWAIMPSLISTVPGFACLGCRAASKRQSVAVQSTQG